MSTTREWIVKNEEVDERLKAIRALKWVNGAWAEPSKTPGHSKIITIKSATSTPWGRSDYEMEYADGVVFFGTPSHGGFRLSKKMNARIPEVFRNADGWYEEDCEYAKVSYFLSECFPETFTAHDGEVKNAKADAERSLKSWNYKQWEAWTGREVDPAESYCKRMDLEKRGAA